ncbi:hypothetical protein GFH48_14660 [Streptomyces fagopyri]|uniref:Uncharacterized protein n=1 Tax=Streptomyces fagopyri TaxID=2662397 RepID=A0A5Q0LBA7_9ACTN|nr:hypothetical protein GFH48_14660 [Streptomyces fagopyri]
MPSTYIDEPRSSIKVDTRMRNGGPGNSRTRRGHHSPRTPATRPHGHTAAPPHRRPDLSRP